MSPTEHSDLMQCTSPELYLRFSDGSFYLVKAFHYDAFLQEILDLLERPLPVEEAPPAADAFPDANAASLSQGVEKYIAQLLLQLGIPPHVHGYKFLCHAVQAVAAQPDLLDSVSARLYPAIANLYGTTAVSVERSIRHAIAMAWEKKGPEAFDKIRSRDGFFTGERPGNREFLALLAERVRLRMLGK